MIDRQNPGVARLRRSLLGLAAVLAVVVGLVLPLGQTQTASATTPCGSACENVSSDPQVLAQQLMDAHAQGRLTEATIVNGSIFTNEIGRIANGTISQYSDCDIDTRVLQTLVVVVRSFDSVQLTDLNRWCANDGSNICGEGDSSPNHCARPAYAIDFGAIEGVAVDGSNSKSMELFSVLDSFLPAGMHVGQSQCRSASLPSLGFTNLSNEFWDGCHHVHIDFSTVNGAWPNVTDGPSTPPLMARLMQLPSSYVATANDVSNVFAITDAGGIEVSSIENGQPSWSSWSAIGGTGVTELTSGYNEAGNVEVFAVGTGGEVLHSWSDGVGGWASPVPLGSTADMFSLTVGYNAIDQQELFGLGTDGVPYHTSWVPGEGWEDWMQLGTAEGLVRISASYNVDGDLEVFGIDEAGDLYSSYYSSALGDWIDWEPIAAGSFVDLVALKNPGDTEVFLLDAAGEAQHLWFEEGVGWSAIEQLGTASGLTSIEGGLNSDGYAEIFALDSIGRVVHAWLEPGVGWSDWDDIGGTAGTERLTLGYNSPGEFEVFGSKDGEISHSWFMPGIGWATWQSMGGTDLRFGS